MPASKRDSAAGLQNVAPLTDSPWFWMLLFAVFATIALAAVSGKYGRRQSIEERKYQARERLVRDAADDPDRRPLSREDDTLIPLWPLAVIAALVAIVSGVMLYRRFRTCRAAAAEATAAR